jgi:SET domain-containing protein
VHYQGDGRLSRVLSGSMSVTECTAACRCAARCGNNVLQRERDAAVGPGELEVFHAAGKGWSLRTLVPLAERRFLLEYVGEVIDDAEAERRGAAYDAEGQSFLFEMHHHEGDAAPFQIDSKRFGNVSRFINHSCDPNLVAVEVRIESVDSRLAHIAFFTRRRVAAGEELTVDYHYEAPHGAQHRIPCLCGAANCRKFLW